MRVRTHDKKKTEKIHTTICMHGSVDTCTKWTSIIALKIQSNQIHVRFPFILENNTSFRICQCTKRNLFQLTNNQQQTTQMKCTRGGIKMENEMSLSDHFDSSDFGGFCSAVESEAGQFI
jgi:hypothetical protein